MGDDRWVALHVFYASDANPILVEAVRPLVDELRRDQLIDGWFFIKYWMEGPHIRVRFKPSSPELRDEVTQRATAALEEFLKRRPALYDTDVDGLDDLYKRMYVAEYGEESWNEKYGDGGMPYRPNNSVALMPYDPEYDRYGGPVGIDIAEWHFEHSSDLVALLLATSNAHVRPVLLGMATQLSLMTAYTFLHTDEAVRRFFQRYRTFWETSYQEPSDDYHSSFEKSFDRTRETLLPRIERIRSVAAAMNGTADATGDEPSLSQIERRWLAHCAELRDRVLDAASRGELLFPSRQGEGRSTIDEPEALATVLLSSYIHMTNNRLGVAILDEIYLSYLIERALTPAEELVETA
ncbi:thiopeptide-type bacteriocin biosynthesis protein [Phytoactinopolyspora halotolerans]|uniref:Lantibiotic biosynthesis protein n=1 Tax=Phytoactinopolyspora halotolerans TaxID=1981512 RepID=A0A6L9SH32_9ACTN|nr:thiopeptide-type bacteriocin biosynthesis protein [Phytoactinopolyspora halotolerans]NEE03722.1 lantibiotic biosynthesis protein [Phytoactinopolyspora halotolerans]